MLRKLIGRFARPGRSDGYSEPLETATGADNLYQVYMRVMVRINAAEEAYYVR